jgi:hypothetical protein
MRRRTAKSVAGSSSTSMSSPTWGRRDPLEDSRRALGDEIVPGEQLDRLADLRPIRPRQPRQPALDPYTVP